MNGKKAALGTARGIAAVGAVIFFAASFSLQGFSPLPAAERKTAPALTAAKDVTEEYKEALDLSDYVDRDRLVSPVAPAERRLIVSTASESMLDRYLASESIRNTYGGFSAYAASAEGIAYRKKLEKEHEKLLAELDRSGIDYTLNYTYSAALSGISVTVGGSDAAGVEALPSAQSVIYAESYLAPQAEATYNEVNVYSSGIYDSSDLGYRGEGMLVAILDTGLDYTHPAFQTMPPSPALRRADVSKIVSSGALAAASVLDGLTVGDVYVNEKVPYAFDYANGDNNVYPISSSHGTHVAGIIAGKDDAHILDDGTSFIGVAPDAQLAIFKVFPDTDSGIEEGAPADALLAALSDCLLVGVDVINMSLGSSCGFARASDADATNEIYDNIRAAGINLVVAASNSASSASNGAYGSTNLASNPDSATVGSPSTYSAAISVASVSGQLSPYLLLNDGTAAYYREASNSARTEFDFAEEILGGKEEAVFDFVVVPGYGRATNYSARIRNALAKGNCIAVVKRGETNFEEKQKIAAQFGAVGCIIYNNVSGVISASLGTGKEIPTCTVTQAVGLRFEALGTGTVTVSSKLKAGPFMSDFSSWGPTPDLGLKPEITAHGGEITSSVIGGGYDEYSGTSMAAPNMAGAVTLLRQYVEKRFPELNAVERAARVYQLLMSTATICYNEEGNPYSPRKQGAGLADIYKATRTGAYLYVDNSDKTKIELGDDKNRTGVYTLNFKAENFSDSPKSYNVEAIAMTEQLSTDGITVAEMPYMLGGGRREVYVDGKPAKGTITIPAGETVSIRVTVALSGAEKQYLNDSFENGMYVEGFVRLLDSEAGGVDLVIPYLAFYGDWRDAPVFDATAYEVSADYFDDTIDDRDKTIAAIYETIAIGKYYRGLDLYMPLGSYVYLTEDDEPAAESTVDKIAVGGSDYGIYQLYAVYFGMLRGVRALKLDIVNDATGEVLRSETQPYVRKSYSTVPSFSLLELSPKDLGLLNNEHYTMRFTGILDYENAEDVGGNTLELGFWVDYQSPDIATYAYRFEEGGDGERLVYLDLGIYDNHYLQCVQVFAPVTESSIDYLCDYPIPVIGTRDSINRVSINITPYLRNFASAYAPYKNCVGLYFIDYAMNSSGYLLPITFTDVDEVQFLDDGGSPITQTTIRVGQSRELNLGLVPRAEDGVGFVEDVTFTSSNSCVRVSERGEIFGYSEGQATITAQSNITGKRTTLTVTVEGAPGEKATIFPLGIVFERYNNLTMSQRREIEGNALSLDGGSVLDFTVSFRPWYVTADDLAGSLSWSSSDPDILQVDPATGRTTCVGTGVATVRVRYEAPGASPIAAQLTISVDEVYEIYAGYMYRYNGAGGTVIIPANLGIVYLGHYSEGDEGPFYGNGSITTVVVPQEVTSIGYRTFYGSSIRDVYLPSTLLGISAGAFYQCTNLRNVYWIIEDAVEWDDKRNDYTVPFSQWVEGVHYTRDCTAVSLAIGSDAFAYCSSLRTIDLSKTYAIYSSAFWSATALQKADISNVRYMGGSVFFGCSALSDVTTSENTVYNRNLFYGCNLSEFTFLGTTVPEGMLEFNTSLSTVTFANDITEVGPSALYGCTSLSTVNFGGSCGIFRVSAFGGCTSLRNVVFPARLATIESSAFSGCSSLTSIEIDARALLAEIGPYVFDGCAALTTFSVGPGSLNFTVQSFGGYSVLYSYDRDKIVLVPPALSAAVLTEGDVTAIGDSAFVNNAGLEGVLEIPDGVTEIGNAAFMNCSKITKVILPASVKKIGKYAFYGCSALEEAVIKGNLESVPDSAFGACRSLMFISLPDSVESIGASAFTNCTSLRYLEIPARVESLGNYAFSSCTVLSDLIFAENSALREIGYRTFQFCYSLNTFTMPDSVEIIGNRAFTDCRNLQSVYISGGLTAMGESVFYGCDSLKRAEFGEGARVIGKYAFSFLYSEENLSFYYNDSLEEVVIPESMSIIGDYAFAACRGLGTLDLTGVDELRSGAFMGCTNLREVTFGGDTYVGARSFNGCSSLAEVKGFGGVTLVGGYAFYECTSLASIDLSGVRQIGNGAFADCALTRADLSSAEIIYAQAFIGCEDLASVTFSKLTVLGGGAFFGTGLTSVTLPATLEEIYAPAFSNCPSLTAIGVAKENERFFADDAGALYENLPNGTYRIVCVPNIVTEDGKYAILDGTSVVGGFAFAYSSTVTHVVIPASCRQIGESAFYAMSMKDERLQQTTLEFLCYNAPELLASAVDDTSVQGSDIYLNFALGFGYAANDNIVVDVISPSNGSGYDGYLWVLFQSYADGTGAVGDIAATDDTEDLIRFIRALDLESLTYLDYEEVAAYGEYASLMSAEQKAFVSEGDLAKLDEAVSITKRLCEEHAAETPPATAGGKKGCGGAVGAFSLAGAAAVLAALILRKKKEGK